MGLMELGCTLEDFGRLAQPASSNRPRCQSSVVSERYLMNLRKSVREKVWPMRACQNEIFIGFFGRLATFLIGPIPLRF